MTEPNRGGARVGTQALSAAISTVLSVASGAAAAQEQPPEVVGLDEVIVTATKRAESLQDVSESISAFDSNAIAMRGLQQIDDVAKYIPGLSLAQREPGGTTIVFRGVATSGIAVRRRVLLGAVPRRAADYAERPQPGPAIHRHRANRGAARSAGHAVRRELPVRHAARHHEQAGPVRLRRLGRGARCTRRRRTVPRATTSAPWSTFRSASASRCASSASRPRTRATSTTCSRTARAERSTTRTSSRRTSTASETNGGRAALRFDITENVDLTLGAIYQDVRADGHSDMNVVEVPEPPEAAFRPAGRPPAGALRGREPRRRVVPARADRERVAAVRRPGRRRLLLRPQVRL